MLAGVRAVLRASLGCESAEQTPGQGSRHPQGSVADGLDTGLADDLEAWEQHERVSHCRKQVTFSQVQAASLR
jgi:hypothetical protein